MLPDRAMCARGAERFKNKAGLSYDLSIHNGTFSMTLSLEELTNRGRQADKFITDGGSSTAKVLPGVSSEAVAQRAYALLKKRSRFLHSAVAKIETSPKLS